MKKYICNKIFPDFIKREFVYYDNTGKYILKIYHINSMIINKKCFIK